MAAKNTDIFQHSLNQQIERESPLANRMRPRTLDEFVGQEHIVGHGRLLRRAIEADQLSSLIFYGPPGTGKTTLAMVIANTTESDFVTLNAVLDGVKQLREVIADAQERRGLYGRRTTLFVDEVHRWNKAQQDALLPHVERGTIILIGATTENPYFEVNKALVSRSRIFQLLPLNEDHLRVVVQQVLDDAERGYGALDVAIAPDALDHLVNVANGDARSVLNALELAVETTEPAANGAILIDLDVAEESIQRRAVLYDKDGDAHYDTISAFIKSVRGSDPDAALYWAAKMVYAGEDPRFIFRRMAILASEDVGMADPNAVTVVTSCWQAFERLGLPEGQFPLAQAILYLATAPKSNTTLGFFDALKAVQAEREADVPSPIKDGNRDKKGFGHGVGYKYPHAYQDHWVAQQYLPGALQGRVFYQPSDQGYEGTIATDVLRRREEQLAVLLESGDVSAEILTMSPDQRGRDAWLQRTTSGTGKTLGVIRDRIFELARPARHHLILDLTAGSGLLLWEAVRRAPEGGVWGVAPDSRLEQLTQQAQRLDELARPRLVASPEALAASDVRFDRIVAYNPLTHLDARRGDMADWCDLLLPDGMIVLAQAIPSAGQRIHELINWTDSEGAPGQTAERVAAAESALWTDPANPATNWDADALHAALAATGWTVSFTVEVISEQRRLARAMVRRWFEEESTYRLALLDAGVSAETIPHLQTIYLRQLGDQIIPWATQVAFATLHKPQS